MSMDMNMNPAVYWYKNQIAVTFHADISSAASITAIQQKVVDHQNELNALLQGTNYTLKVPGGTTPQQMNQMNEGNVPTDTGNLDGVYVFPTPFQKPPPGITFVPVNDLVAFYSIEITPAQGGNSGTGGMSGMSGMGNMSDVTGTGNADSPDVTIDVIKHLYAQKGTIETSFDAMPYWFHAGTGDPTHGCPITPPFPAPGHDQSGQWKYVPASAANAALQHKTGAGVTVFILDAFPTAEQITAAANKPGCNNLLLKGMANGMVSAEPFNAVPPAINLNYFDGSTLPQDVVTGKDLYGRLAGFPLVDHGVTVAGIVRDLAPNANIECIRVLNDYGVGDLKTLFNAWMYILHRLMEGGDLHKKPVVINMSLVIGPPEGDLSRLGLDDATLQQILTGLHPLLQNLTSLGAILVASSGNDTDPRDTMHAAGTRLGPRYPAAFAYDLDAVSAASIIPVGAVNGKGEAASYSNYPGTSGIATYGGEIPTPSPAQPDPTVITKIDPSVPLDVLYGVYCSPMYPALSEDDHYPPPSPQPPAYPEYPAPNADAWAYWAGTSFATPVISAFAACLLEGQAPDTMHVRQTMMDSVVTQHTSWSGMTSGAPAAGPTIMVSQEFIAGT